jgi:microcystin-dependent protein
MSEPAWVPLGNAVGPGLPAGSIIPYGGAAAPIGWLLCDGSAVLRTYTELFDAIGVAFGAGDGSTTFNLPDLRGRVAVGKGLAAAVDALGDSDGVAVANRRPQHRHTPHSHSYTRSLYQASFAGPGISGANATDSPATGTADGGSGVAADSLDAPAYLVVNYIIKIAAGSPATVPTSAPPLLTALPGSPVDGQEIILTDSLTAGTYAWHLRYVAGRATNKWMFVGGAPLAGDNAAQVAANATTYATPSGAITLVVPVAGLYLVQLGFRNTAWTSAVVYMSYAIGGTGAVDADACMGGPQITPGSESQNFRSYRKTFAAAATLTEQLKVTGGNNNPYHRFLSVTPIAVGG